MPSCCVVGCKSLNLRNKKVTFYIIPCERKRRNLWLQAIHQANGSDELDINALICGDHFVSGEASADRNSPDFVPSIFTYSAIQRAKRKRDRESYTSSVETDKETTLPDKGELSEEVKSQSEEDEMENGVINIESEAAFNLQRTSPSHEAAAIPKLGTRRPVILLKSVFNQAGAYQCDSCDGTFTDVSQFVKHKQRHDEERPLPDDVDMSVPFEISEEPVNNEAFTDHVLKDELPFKCNMCERSFSMSRNLKRHKLLHVKDGRKCGQCGVLFCQSHNHVLFRPQPVIKSEVEEDASTDETQPVNVNLTPENSQKDVELNTKAETDNESYDAMTATSSKPKDVANISESKTEATWPLIPPPIPDPKMLDPSRPPSPTLIRYYRKSALHHFNPTPLNDPKTLVQPHLPVLPYLPPSLQMFSPQCLTSSFLEVKRNYACIFGKLLTVNAVKEEPDALPVTAPPQQQ